MKNDFSEIKEELSHKFEDLLIEISLITSPTGLSLFYDDTRVLKEWITLMDSLERQYLNTKDKSVARLGGENNED